MIMSLTVLVLSTSNAALAGHSMRPNSKQVASFAKKMKAAQAVKIAKNVKK